MVEPNKLDNNEGAPGKEDTKSNKVQILPPDQTTGTVSEETQAADTNEEEMKGQAQGGPRKPIDQSKSNLPVDADVQDLKELLESYIVDMDLKPEEKGMLDKSIETGKFKSGSAMVVQLLRKRGQFDAASKLDDIAPLFDPHVFWDMQPVPKPQDSVQLPPEQFDQAIEVKTVEQVSEQPYTLPPAYHWCNLDLSDDAVAQEVYDLLVQNYVEDDDAMFRFDYSIPFLRWALLPPDGKQDWIVGVRGGKKNRLFGCITGIPVTMSINGQVVKCAEINFLCVHKSLRAKRLAPVLIKEITRRVNRYDIWQAIYTAGVTIPTPFTGATYWHRSLNPKKLVDVRFSSLPANTPMSRYIRLQKLRDVAIPNMRVMVERDVPQVTALLNTYLSDRKVHIKFTEEDVAHFLLPREDVIYAFVVEQQGTITDFFSFYNLPSTILRHPDYNLLKVAYSFYNVSTTGRLLDGMSDMLIKAKELNFDVFNALDVMENKTFLEELKFGIGDGQLHYYFFNWRVKDITPADVGIVLV